MIDLEVLGPLVVRVHGRTLRPDADVDASRFVRGAARGIRELRAGHAEQAAHGLREATGLQSARSASALPAAVSAAPAGGPR